MSERHDLRCVASLTAAPGLAIKAVSCFCITVSRRSSAQNPRIGRISSPRRPPGRLERLAIALAYRKTLARLCRGRGLAWARLGFSLGAAAIQRRHSVTLCFWRVSPRRSERRRTCSCGNPARRLLGRAGHPRRLRRRRVRSPGARASLRRAKSSDRGVFNQTATRDTRGGT